MAEPLCNYFGKCNGCSSQHIDYPLQIENKKKFVGNSLKFEDVKVFSGKDYAYRSRMDFIFHNGGLGFRGRDGKIVDVEKCVICEDKVDGALKELRDFFKNVDYFDLKKRVGTFRYAVIRKAKDEIAVSFVLNSDSKKLESAVALIKDFSEKTKINNIIVTYVDPKIEESISEEYFVVKGKDMLEEDFLGKKFLYSVQGFFQNNHQMAEKMHEYCNGILKGYDAKGAFLLDLYGGVGTFGIINSELFKEVLVVEGFEKSIDSANENIKKNNRLNVKAFVLDANKISRLDIGRPLFVITDPPRSGMDEKTIQHLKAMRPKVILYVSCNVQQLKKDVPKFKDYKIKSAAMFDFFPQTPHLEVVVELVLK